METPTRCENWPGPFRIISQQKAARKKKIVPGEIRPGDTVFGGGGRYRLKPGPRGEGHTEC